MEKAPLYQLNVYSFLTPIFGLYFGYMFFSESLSFAQWLGVILVIFAIPLASISPGQKTT
ncbi:EamA family transporter [Permianibacter aggregans]|nr:EamA family transporter [Permianibacter aggregans]